MKLFTDDINNIYQLRGLFIILLLNIFYEDDVLIDSFKVMETVSNMNDKWK